MFMSILSNINQPNHTGMVVENTSQMMQKNASSLYDRSILSEILPTVSTQLQV